MLNKMVKNKKQIIIAALIIIGLGVGLSFYTTWSNAQKEINNVKVTREEAKRVTRALGENWIDKSSCYLSRGTQFGAKDYYYCDSVYVVDYAPRNKDEAIALFLANSKKLNDTQGVSGVSRGTSFGSQDTRTYAYDLVIQKVTTDSKMCSLDYLHGGDKQTLSGKLTCHKQVSHEAYDMLAKSGYPITTEQ